MGLNSFLSLDSRRAMSSTIASVAMRVRMEATISVCVEMISGDLRGAH